MTEHVCPVGALTTRDFRFKARVWFLRSGRQRLPGVRDRVQRLTSTSTRGTTPPTATGRATTSAVNKYWMCDEGMLTYKRAHEQRLLDTKLGGRVAGMAAALEAARKLFEGPTHAEHRGRPVGAALARGQLGAARSRQDVARHQLLLRLRTRTATRTPSSSTRTRTRTRAACSDLAPEAKPFDQLIIDAVAGRRHPRHRPRVGRAADGAPTTSTPSRPCVRS